MSVIGDRIKELRKKNDLSQVEMATLLNNKFSLNIERSMISKWETGFQQPMMATVICIAKLFNVSIDYLNGDNESPNIFVRFATVVKYPIIGEVSAGYNGIADEVETGECENIPAEWLKGYDPSGFFVLQVKGDSMYPDYQDGDRVLVHRQSSVDSGTIAIILYDSEMATLKKVKYAQGEDWLDLVPRNPEYNTKRIEGENLSQCRILGEVKRLIRLVK